MVLKTFPMYRIRWESVNYSFMTVWNEGKFLKFNNKFLMMMLFNRFEWSCVWLISINIDRSPQVNYSHCSLLYSLHFFHHFIVDSNWIDFRKESNKLKHYSSIIFVLHRSWHLFIHLSWRTYESRHLLDTGKFPW